MKKKILSVLILFSIIFLGTNSVACTSSKSVVSTRDAYRIAIGVSPAESVSESQNLNYFQAYNVNATISAEYYVANCQPIELLTQSGARQITVTAGEGSNAVAENFVNPQGIELTYENDYFVVNVSFTNNSVLDNMIISPSVNFNAIVNFNVHYSVDDGAFVNAIQDSIVVEPGQTKVCHIKFSIADLANYADMNLDTAINYAIGRA